MRDAESSESRCKIAPNKRLDALFFLMTAARRACGPPRGTHFEVGAERQEEGQERCRSIGHVLMIEKKELVVHAQLNVHERPQLHALEL
jgi:hypothetical protein